MARRLLTCLRPVSAIILFCLTGLLQMPLALASSTTAEQLARLQVPPGSRLLSVGTDLDSNGHIMSVASFESAQPLADTVAFFRENWTEAASDNAPGLSPSPARTGVDGDSPQESMPALVENRIGSWLVLGRLQDGFQQVLQLNLDSPHKSSGYLSVMQIGVGVHTGEDITLPGMELLSSTGSRDTTRTGRLSVYRASATTEALRHQLARFWEHRGWQAVSDRAEGAHRIQTFNRRNAQLDVVIGPGESGGSLVVVNEVEMHGQ